MGLYHGNSAACSCPAFGAFGARSVRALWIESTSIDEALRAACDGVAGITPAQFRALLSPEDIDDIAAGAIHSKTLHGYTQSFAEGIRSGRIAALPEREGAKPGPVSGSIVMTEAEIEAARKGRILVKQGDFTGAPEVKP